MAALHRRTIDPDQGMCLPLAHLVDLLEISDGLAPGGQRHFDSRSFTAALSSNAPTESPFRLEFSSSNRATSQSLDGFRADLSYGLHLLIGLSCVKVDHGGRLTAMGGMGPLMVVEGDPPPDAGLGLRSSFPGVQVDAFILQGPPETLDEDVVEAAPLAIHRDSGANPFQPGSPGEGCEL
jgi:hypothetical protein